ncbi:hypothetical protein NLU13_0836 [Sarocladium strictum]|uniref:Uncharacterized protein n=1 Tax=Sarocladium strictum TaxID=5046 RepID=A0AA39GPT0_SARSR|nr:hypothetical protein NLU13_0836 [Sarocladium strictum]
MRWPFRRAERTVDDVDNDANLQDKRSPVPLLFEPDEFPADLTPQPDELFVHGDFPDQVLFRDERFPGKTFAQDKQSVDDDSQDRSSGQDQKEQDDRGRSETPLLFEPEDFPAISMPKPTELFVHGNFPDKVLFRDDQFPGKVFIYASRLEEDRRKPWHTRPALKGEETKAEETVTNNALEASEPSRKDEATTNNALEASEPSRKDEATVQEHHAPAVDKKRWSWSWSWWPAASDESDEDGCANKSEVTTKHDDGSAHDAESRQHVIDPSQPSRINPPADSEYSTMRIALDRRIRLEPPDDSEYSKKRPSLDIQVPIKASDDSAYLQREIEEYSVTDEVFLDLDLGDVCAVNFTYDQEEVTRSPSAEPFSAQGVVDFQTNIVSAGTLSDKSEPDEQAQELPSLKTEPEEQAQEELLPKPEPFSARDAVEFQTNIASVGTLSDKSEPDKQAHEVPLPKPEPLMEDLAWYYISTTEARRDEQVQQFCDAVSCVRQDLDEEQVESLLGPQEADPGPWSAAESANFLPMEPQDLLHDTPVNEPDSKADAGHAVVQIWEVVKSSIPEPLPLCENCKTTSWSASSYLGSFVNIPDLDLTHCETFCQGLTGCVMVFYFFRPDMLPRIIKRTFRPMISPYMVYQWTWLRLILGFILLLGFWIHGLPDGLLEPVCNLSEKPERWPQIWYYPDSAWPLFAPKNGNMERERRW